MQLIKNIVFYTLLLCFFIMNCGGLEKPAAVVPNQKLKLNFIIEPIVADDSVRLKVDMKFQASPNTYDQIILPSNWGGQKSLFREISNLKALSQNTVIKDTTDPSVKIIERVPMQEVRLSYEVSQLPSHQVNQKRKYYRPIIQTNFVHLIGEAFLIHPKWDFYKPIKIGLIWKNVPQNWHIANSFGVNESRQTIYSSLHDFKSSLYLLGKYRLYHEKINGNSIYVAMRGGWNFKDKDFAELVTTSLEAERDFWHDHSYPHYLVSVIPSGERSGNYAGTNLTNSFALFLSTNRRISFPLKHMVSHEFFHHWNGRQIKRAYPEELVFWFSEGFTEFYARRLNLKAGIISLQDYVYSYNKVLKEYYTSSARHVTNQQILGHFWSNQNINKIPYLKGEILAQNWDYLLREQHQNQSLKNFMYDLFESAKTKGTRISPQSVDEHMRKYLPQGVSKDITSYIDHGALLLPVARKLGACVTLTKSPSGIPQYKLNESLYHDNPDMCLRYFE